MHAIESVQFAAPWYVVGWRDAGTIVRIGVPLIFNNLFSIGVAVADTLMAATLGATQLAGVAIGSGIWIALFLLGLGIVMALGPTVAQHFGAGRHFAIGADTRQGLWLALAISVPIIVAMRGATSVMVWIGVDPTVTVLAQGYLDALSFGVPGAYAYHALKQMSEGVGRTVPIMIVMAIALPLNVLLNYAFMFGRFGAEPLGAIGCGLGNGITFWIMFVLLATHVLRSAHYRPFALASVWEGPARATLLRLAALGLPIGISLFLQSGLFTTVALLMGALGTVAVAAHQVALNYSGLVFMVPLGLAMALTVCVGQAAGREDFHGAARIGVTGIVLCGALAVVSGTTTLIFAQAIADRYSADADVAALAVKLFRVAAFLQLCDGIQVAAAFALRGMKDTRVPLLMNAFSYWAIGFTLAWTLGIGLDHGAVGIWIGLTLALGVAGLLLVARFFWLTARMRRAGTDAVAADV